MDLEKLMNKKISRKNFIKSLGFILLALVFFPRKALSFMNFERDDEKVKKEIKEELKEENFKDGFYVNGVKVIEVIDK